MTRLMYDCGLSYKVTKEYVLLLFEKGLLDFEPVGMIYRPSDKGLLYLGIYKEVKTMANLVDAMKNKL